MTIVFKGHNNKLTALIDKRMDESLMIALEFRYYCQSHMLCHFFFQILFPPNGACAVV